MRLVSPSAVQPRTDAPTLLVGNLSKKVRIEVTGKVGCGCEATRWEPVWPKLSRYLCPSTRSQALSLLIRNMLMVGIEISVRWCDEDLVELNIFASNGRFSGEVSAYASHNTATSFAAALQGFPSNGTDVRKFEIGTFDPSFAGGGARFEFGCLTSTGKAFVDVKLQSDCRKVPRPESSSFGIEIQAAAVDLFVQELKQLAVRDGELASLRAAS